MTNLDVMVSCIIIMAVIFGIGMLVSNYNDGDTPIHGMLTMVVLGMISVLFDVPERLANGMASVDGSDVVEVAKWGIVLIAGLVLLCVAIFGVILCISIVWDRIDETRTIKGSQKE